MAVSSSMSISQSRKVAEPRSEPLSPMGSPERTVLPWRWMERGCWGRRPPLQDPAPPASGDASQTPSGAYHSPIWDSSKGGGSPWSLLCSANAVLRAASGTQGHRDTRSQGHRDNAPVPAVAQLLAGEHLPKHTGTRLFEQLTLLLYKAYSHCFGSLVVA